VGRAPFTSGSVDDAYRDRMRRLWPILLPLIAILVAMHVPALKAPEWLRSLHGEMASLHGAREASATPLTDPVDIPFDLVNRHILVGVRVHDAPLTFIFDTRDTLGIIDIERARSLGLNLGGSVSVVGAGAGSQAGALVSDAGFTLAGLPGVVEPVKVAFPLASLFPALGRSFDGIFGTNFISRFVVEVDYANRRLRLHDRDTWTYAGPGQSVPITLDANGHPTFDGSITTAAGERVAAHFALDLGASAGLTLSTPFVAAHHLPGAGVKTVRAFAVLGAAGASEGRVGRLARVTIGSFDIDDLRAMFSSDTEGAHASTDIDGNVGQPIASRFRLFLDYGHKRIVFEPVSTRAVEPAQSGFAFRAEGADYATLRVSDVLESSPASEAGVKIGDVIQAADGVPTGLSVSTLAERLERPGPCVLTIRRGESTVKVTVTPRRIV
jgi:hypothetical protein